LSYKFNVTTTSGNERVLSVELAAGGVAVGIGITFYRYGTPPGKLLAGIAQIAEALRIEPWKLLTED